MDNENKLEQKKMDAILTAIPWRCYHCDFITNDPAEAKAHFGDQDDASEFVPICKWWNGMNDDERKHTFQDLQRDLTAEQEENGSLRLKIEDLEERIDSQDAAIRSYKPFKDCHSIHDVFCIYDSMEGRALAAEERVRKYEARLGNLRGWLGDGLQHRVESRRTRNGGHDGNGNSWAIVAMPDWDVKQRLEEISEEIGEPLPQR